ncbi:MAG: carbohydrate binding family 9 domain-containing protein [Melioribacteraceae bacterium]|nr:carbohydrate binding family 9 domain-containing protein [Melioribacteraceae bacterium]
MKTKIFLLLLLNFITIYSQIKTVTAVRTNMAPQIDGNLNDEVWNKAIPFSDFLQQEPIAGSNPSYKTEVKILYDENNLYLSVMCYDDEPNKIIAREMKWDGFISADDNIKILFDTFNDNRSAYWFATNPLGAKDDALLTGFEMKDFNEDWNGVWDVECKILENGWSAEFVFPFSTFKFYDNEKQVWGFNIQRTIKRKNEDVLWTSVGQNLGIMKISYAGDLIGIEKIKRGNPIYIKPFITAGAQFSKNVNDKILEPGLDLKYGITETLTLDATINTDFAQVESDRARINLSRFPLFFPEKREFFLEGKKFFDFNLGGNNTIFYSRRIGLKRGVQIPIIAGAKLIGRIDDFEIGLIDMQTAEKDLEPTTNYSAVRLKYDLLNSSYIGFMTTNKAYSKNLSNSIGTDFNFSFNDFLGDKNLVLFGALAKSNNNDSPVNSWAGNFFVDFPNDFIDTFLGYRFIQSGFDPQLGFVSRKGGQQFIYNLEIEPRINKYGIKKLRFQPVESNFFLDGSGNLETASFMFSPIGIVFDSGDQISFGMGRTFDYPKEDFEIFDTTKVKAGKYWETGYGVEIGTSASRDIFGRFEFVHDGFYGGKRSSIQTRVNYTINKHFTISADYQKNIISFKSSNFSTDEFGGRITYNISTKLLSSIFTQWNNELNEININYRFNWKPKIGSDFYIVLNQVISTENKIQSKDFAVLAKFVWMFII